MARVAQVPRARSVQSPPRSKKTSKIDLQSKWNPHSTKMAHVAQVPRARNVESPPKSKKHRKSVSGANGKKVRMTHSRTIEIYDYSCDGAYIVMDDAI
jgi:hypothetical protein